MIMQTPPSHKSKGFALAELLLATMIASSLFVATALMFEQQRRDRAVTEYAEWMAQYVNGVAGYMSAKGVNDPGSAPAGSTRSGTDWLKHSSCKLGSGADPTQTDVDLVADVNPPDPPGADITFLSCKVPVNFNNVYGLIAPKVVFDWSAPSTPSAEITFGVIEPSGEPDTQLAAELAAEINRRLEVDGYEHASAFIIDPSLPASGSAADAKTANLRASIDASIESTVFVRRDGNTVMTGPLRSRHDDWALVARDQNGDVVTSPRDSKASADLNDAFIRSNDAWLSQTHELAVDAYKMAARAPQYMTVAEPGDTITKPVCATSGMTPQIFTFPISVKDFSGSPAASQYLGGVRASATSAWVVAMEVFDIGSGSWRAATVQDEAKIGVITRCK